jgi:hypothetical protein
VDDEGRRQPLLAIYSTSALALAGAEAVGGGAHENLGMMRLIAPIRTIDVRLPAGLCADIDTPDAARAHGIVLEQELEGAHRGI